MAGDGWGPAGPPVEAYERVSDPERFRGLHQAARALLDELAATYFVGRESFLDEERPGGPEPGELLRPAHTGGASLGVTFTDAPGLVVWRGGRRLGHLPMCACDACAETLADAAADLHEIAETVVTGRFGERVGIEHGQWHHITWQRVGPTGLLSEGSHPIDDTEAEQLLARLPETETQWAPWLRRPVPLDLAVLDPARVGVDAGREHGLVRCWSTVDGWGVVDSPATPGGCWVHHSHLDTPVVPGSGGPRALVRGQRVVLEWERASQDGFAFRAVRVIPNPTDDPPTR